MEQNQTIAQDYQLALTQQTKYLNDKYNTTLEDHHLTPQLKINKYQHQTITETFPHLTTYTNAAILKTNIHNMDKYGVALSFPKTLQIIHTINQQKQNFPHLTYNQHTLHPDYIRTSMQLITILHNIHKITTNQIFTTNLHPTYQKIITPNPQPSGISIVNMDDHHITQITQTALQLSTQHKKPLTENNYLTLIHQTTQHNPIHTITNTILNHPQNQLNDILQLPETYINALTA